MWLEMTSILWMSLKLLLLSVPKSLLLQPPSLPPYVSFPQCLLFCPSPSVLGQTDFHTFPRRSILLTVPSMHFVALKTARHAQFCCRVWARQRLQSHDTIPESHTILKMADYYNRSGIPTKSWHQPQLYYWTCFQFPRITKGVQGFLLTVWIATILA